MKKIFIILIFVGLATSIFAQIPEGFSYQAVIRDNNETLVKNQNVAVKATILRNDEPVFEQTQTATTNENGLLTIIIGNESFQDIDWLQGTLFIKTEIDPAGGNNFTIETQTQLLTVPFAMAAKTAEAAVTVQGLEDLIERVNNLENQIEELYLHLGLPIDINFTTIGKGNSYRENLYDNFITKCHWVIKTQAAWDSLLTNISAHEIAQFTETDIDFSKYQVIAVIDKLYGYGGWGTDIIQLTKRNGKIIVNYENSHVGELTGFYSRSYHVVKIPVTDKEVEFQENTYYQELSFGLYTQLPYPQCYEQWIPNINEQLGLKADFKFIDNEYLTYRFLYSDYWYYFKYELTDNTIIFKNPNKRFPWGEFYFRVINNNKFEIQWIGTPNPDPQPTHPLLIMTFEIIE